MRGSGAGTSVVLASVLAENSFSPTWGWRVSGDAVQHCITPFPLSIKVNV